MNEDEYLEALLRRNPGLNKSDDDTVTLRVRGLKAIIRQAFQKGRESGIESQQEYEGTTGDSSRGAALFNKLFGGGNRNGQGRAF